MGGRTLDQFRSKQRANAKKNKDAESAKSSNQEDYKQNHPQNSERE